jgi:ABC transport system ATP-binding/permease protein
MERWQELTGRMQATRAAAPAVRKLGFREKQELETVESDVDDLTAQKENLERRISEAAQEGDFGKVADMTTEMSGVVARLDTATERWMELAERAEAAGTV